ncbi:hypothetical protein [Nesterenkonia xinjiangensis]
MTEGGEPASLWEEAHSFAERLNYLVAGVLVGDLPQFRAEEHHERLVVVSTGTEAFRLRRSLSDAQFALLDVSFHCVWNSSKSFLGIHKSTFKLRGPDGGHPVFHMDYLRRPHSRSVPVAHYNVSSQHPVVREMVDPAGAADDPESTRKIHIPVGGHRFRPTLEDVLQMLITDFNVECKPGWRGSIEEGRGIFRETQTAAAVLDHPQKAAEELRRQGFSVEWTGPPKEQPVDIRAESFYRY